MERFAQRVMFVTECGSILGASCSVAFMLEPFWKFVFEA
jgi:hypothetical protein